MSTVINTNLASLFAQNSLSNAQNNLATSVQRLSSGLRINSAKDDAAGLAIAQNMQSQLNGTNQSIQNLNNATNLLQTADSSLSTIQDMLLRLKQLATQGYDGSLNVSQKLDIVQQMKDLNSEINATASRTAFNGINLLSSGSSVDNVNSALKSGVVLQTTPVTLDPSQYSLGYYSAAGAGSATGLNDAASTGTGTNSTFSIVLDPTKSNSLPGTYTLTQVGANLTLSGTINGQATSQTVTVQDVNGGATPGGVQNYPQSIDFSNFGIKINTQSTVAQGTTESGTTLANAIYKQGLGNGTNVSSIKINGASNVVKNVNLSGVGAGTYTMSFSNTGSASTISMPTTTTGFSTSGIAGTQIVSLGGGSGSGATAAVSYNAAGTITSIALQNQGTGYKAGDLLTMGQSTLSTSEATTAQFRALAAGQNLILGGLTFTAGTSGATAQQVANAFSNLQSGWTGTQANTANGLTGASSGGTFAAGGTLTAGYSTGAVSGSASDTVVFQNNGLASIALGVSTGSATLNTTYGSYGVDAITTSGAAAPQVETLTLGAATSYLAKGTVVNLGGSLTYTLSKADTVANVMTVLNGGAAGGATSIAAGATAATLNALVTTTTAANGSFAGTAGTGAIKAPTAGSVITLTAAGNGVTPAVLSISNSTLINGAEQNAVAFAGPITTSGQQVSVAGLTFTSNGTSISAAQLAGIFSNLSSGQTSAAISTALGTNLSTFGTLSGSVTTGLSSGLASSGTVTFYGGNSAITATGPTAALTPTVTTTAATVAGIDVTQLTAGQSGQNLLTVTGQVNGQNVTQAITVQAGAAYTTQNFNFSSFGISFDVQSNQSQTAGQIGAALASLENSTGAGYTTATTPGQIIVSQGTNSNLQFQSGANSAAFIAINTINVQTGTTGVNAGSNSAMMSVGTDISGVNGAGATAVGTLGAMSSNNTISDWSSAFQNAASAIDNAVDYISTQRSVYGSQMNRLSYISSNLTAQSTNLQNSRSAITDTNFASETATLTKGQIMQQAATAMLAQANQMPNVILSLLK